MKKIKIKILKFLYKLKNFLIFGKWGILVFYSIKIDDKYINGSCIINDKNILSGLEKELKKKYKNFNILFFEKEYKQF